MEKVGRERPQQRTQSRYREEYAKQELQDKSTPVRLIRGEEADRADDFKVKDRGSRREQEDNAKRRLSYSAELEANQTIAPEGRQLLLEIAEVKEQQATQ